MTLSHLCEHLLQRDSIAVIGMSVQGMLMRPEYHEAKAEAEARKCEAKAEAKKSCEAEANIYEAEAMRPVTTMHLHSTTKNLFSLTMPTNKDNA